jgi:hypothetical protein
VELELKASDKPKSKRFVKPTPEEAEAYAREIGFPIEQGAFLGEHFIDFYAARGWKLSGKPMKDWKACVRTWFGNYKANNPDFVPVPQVSEAEKAKNKAAREKLRKQGHQNNNDLFGDNK